MFYVDVKEQVACLDFLTFAPRFLRRNPDSSRPSKSIQGVHETVRIRQQAVIGIGAILKKCLILIEGLALCSHLGVDCKVFPGAHYQAGKQQWVLLSF